MKRPAVDLDELPPEVRALARNYGAPGGRRSRSMSAEEVRSHALRVLGMLAQLTQSERSRVLRKALDVNAV